MTASRDNRNGMGMDRVLKWLPLAIIALVSAVAWGSQQTATKDHERRITGNEKLLQKLMPGQARIEERTHRMSEDVKENKTLLLQMLRELRNGKDR